MYSRQNRSPRAEISVDLPRDYSGSAFSPFPSLRDMPVYNSAESVHKDEKNESCRDGDKKAENKDECCENNSTECAISETRCPEDRITERPGGLLGGLSGLLGGNIGLEELLLLGVIFLIFSDDSLRDNELLICLLLILFI